MKRLLSYGILAVLLVCIILFATGIVTLPAQGNGGGNSTKSSSSADTDISQADSSAASAVTQTQDFPYIYAEVINDANTINAVVDVPDEVRKNGYYEATATVLTFEDKADDILTYFEGYHPYLHATSDEAISYWGDDDFILNFDPEYMDLTFVTGTYWNAVRYAYNFSVGVEEYNRDHYPEETAFDDFSLEECDESIQSLFSLLEFQGELYTRHWMLDYETMEEEAVELFMDGTDRKPEYDWSEEDDCYWCEIWQTCNGVRIINTRGLQGAGDVLEHGTHTVVTGKSGVFSMETTLLYDISYSEEKVKLCDFEEIVEVYRQSSAEAAEASPIEITDIALLVIPVSVRGEGYSLVPVWIFYGQRSIELDGSSLLDIYAVYINATTGEVIR